MKFETPTIVLVKTGDIVFAESKEIKRKTMGHFEWDKRRGQNVFCPNPACVFTAANISDILACLRFHQIVETAEKS